MTLRRSKSERESSCPTKCVVRSEASFMLPAISASLPVWLCVSSEKPSSKLEGARLIPGASCTNRVGEAGACSAMFRWRMLCGVRTSHAQASVLAVAGIQLVMLVMLVVVVWVRQALARERRSITVSRAGRPGESSVVCCGGVCLRDSRPEYRLPTTFGPRSTASADGYSDIDGSTGRGFSALRASRSVGTTRFGHVQHAVVPFLPSGQGWHSTEARKYQLAIAGSHYGSTASRSAHVRRAA